MKKIIFDPPEGWAFGFPRAIPEEILALRETGEYWTAMEEWLRTFKYPRGLMKLAREYSRCWEEEVK